ncbi:MAG TPA: helix-turn-helix domain-containing protein [Egibacteraceae bacterium]|jgi:excisionase family DNA binding protein|nr:helix-turn-helix domain-containing protein [Egibacteraceae bacterium]
MAERREDDDLPPVLDAGQVARLLNLNIDYVRKLSRQGVLPAHRLPGGRTFRYFKDEVLDWLRNQPVHHPADAGARDPRQR